MGNCQICEGDFKLHNGTMVHHGYERPGDGFIHGDCTCVSHPPYEVSCDMLKQYLVGLLDGLKGTKLYLERLIGGEVLELTVERRDYEASRCGKPAYKRVKVLKGELEWATTFKSETHQVESKISNYYSEIKRVEARIAAWKPMPVREFDEELRNPVKAAEKALRAAEREAKRVVKAAKVAATKAKMEALAAKRAAIKADLEAKFLALAADAGDEARNTAWTLLRVEMSKGKYNWLSWYEFSKVCKDALVKLGVIRSEVSGDRTYYHY